MSSQVGRADLVECLRIYGPAHLEHMAIALGYRIVPEPVKATLPVRPPEPGDPTPEPETGHDETAVTERPRAWFHRVLKRIRATSPEEARREPEGYRRAQPFRLGDPEDQKALHAPPGARPPQAPPLMPWRRLWPFLRLALGQVFESHAPDLPRVVELLARGRWLRRLPRVACSGWAGGAQVIVDLAEPLLPFWSDFSDLRERLARLRGRGGLVVLAFPDGDPGGRCWRATPDGWRDTHGYRPPSSGTPVLVLSDLGCNDVTSDRRVRWLRFGRSLGAAGCRPVALMPCPPRLWDDELRRAFIPVCWDRAARPPRRLAKHRGAGTAPALCPRLQRDSEQAVRLLTLLSPAVRVEPPLLRAVRHLLALDVGDEAAAWNHRDVHPTLTAFYFHRGSVAQYRAHFSDDPCLTPELRNEAARLIVGHHAYLSPVIAHEERLILAGLPGGTGHGLDGAEEFMWRLTRTLREAGKEVKGPARDWVSRMAGRQHSSIWANEAVAAAWVAVHEEELLDGASLSLPDGLEPDVVAWLLQGERSVQMTLRQRGESLWFDGGESASSDGSNAVYGDEASSYSLARGSMVGMLHTRSQCVEIEWRDGQGLRRCLHPIGQPVTLSPELCRVTAVGQETLVLDCIHRPGWASAIGRDEAGLWATVALSGRRVCWVEPRGLPVHDRSGGPALTFEIDEGFWCDAEEAGSLLTTGLSCPGWANGYGVDDHGIYADVRMFGVVQRFRWMAPGSCLMGSPATERGRDDDERQHEVTLSRGFWLADTACTQALWRAAVGKNPSRFREEEANPVEQVSWDDVQGFLAKVNATVQGLDVRLPTEAEWEYACRAGTATPFSFGDTITPEQVNYDGNYPYGDGVNGLYRQMTVRVKSLPPNAWGLYEMHGNVREWCTDWFGEYGSAPVVDPVGPAEGATRVLRGGSWDDGARNARSADRSRRRPAYSYGIVGFRLAQGWGASKKEGEKEGSPGERTAFGRATAAERGGEVGGSSRLGRVLDWLKGR